MSPVEIRIEWVSEIFEPDLKMLQGAGVRMAKNRFPCLLGPSGGGKSTLLSLIA